MFTLISPRQNYSIQAIMSNLLEHVLELYPKLDHDIADYLGGVGLDVADLLGVVEVEGVSAAVDRGSDVAAAGAYAEIVPGATAEDEG